MNSNKKTIPANRSLCSFNSQIPCDCHSRIPKQFIKARLQSNANIDQNIVHMHERIKTLQEKSEDGKANVYFLHKVKQTINMNWDFGLSYKHRCNVGPWQFVQTPQCIFAQGSAHMESFASFKIIPNQPAEKWIQQILVENNELH